MLVMSLQKGCESWLGALEDSLTLFALTSVICGSLLWVVQKPINPYGKAKKMAEDLIKDYARTNKKLAVTLLRCCS